MNSELFNTTWEKRRKRVEPFPLSHYKIITLGSGLSVIGNLFGTMMRGTQLKRGHYLKAQRERKKAEKIQEEKQSDEFFGGVDDE